MFLGKSRFFCCDFDLFYGSMGCATKFHADEIYIFLLLSLLDKKKKVLREKVAIVEHTICDCNHAVTLDI